MKVFVVVSCLLAVASAEYWEPSAHHGAQHVPAIESHGVPLEPPANVAARAAHAAAYAAATGHGGGYTAAPGLTYAAAPTYEHAPSGHGAPHDTPEVAAAKAAHFAAHATTGGNAGHGIYGAAVATPYAYAPALGHGHGALPHDTPEVAAAKAAHLAAHAAAANGGHGAVHGGHGEHYAATPGLTYAVAPAYGHAAAGHGAPNDTPEVTAAKAAHFAAHATAGGNAGHGIYGAAVATPYAYAPALSHGHGALPHDTPEVAAAKAAHLAAHAASANGGHGAVFGGHVAANGGHNAVHGGYDGNYAAAPGLTHVAAPAYEHTPSGHGAPHDTPEVAAAKAAHFAAHATAGGNGGNGIYGAAVATPYAYAPALGHGRGALPHDTPEVAAAKAAHLAALSAAAQGGHDDIHGGHGVTQGAYDDGSYHGEYDSGAYSHGYDDGSYHHGGW